MSVDVVNCRRYIRHLCKVLPKMISCNGDPIGCLVFLGFFNQENRRKIAIKLICNGVIKIRDI